jgi:Transcriptional regulator
MPKAIVNARENIMSSVKRVLMDQGYESLNMRDIAASCGLGIGTVYNYFDSKEEIVKEIMIQDWAKTLSAMDIYILNKYDVLSAFRGIFSELKQFVDLYRDTWFIMYNMGGKKYKIEDIRYSRFDILNDLKSRIAHVIKSSNTQVSNLDFTAEFIVNNFTHYSMENDFIYNNLEQIIIKILK